MPRRRTRALLPLWTGPVSRNAGFKTVLLFCVGCQRHNGRLKLADLPDWDWYLRAPEVHRMPQGRMGRYRMDWGEVIDFAKGVSG